MIRELTYLRNMISSWKKLSLLIWFFLSASICSAQFTSRKITCKQDSNLTFPIFTGENKAAAKKINDHLQMEFFETTNSQIPESRLFDGYRFISDDIKSQTGYTSISYNVELNSSKILSVIFEVEGMGAYPTQYKKYFSFDSKTGKRISGDTVFTAEGLKAIKEMLINKRKEGINKWIGDLKTNNEETYAEDSSFIEARFSECNAKAHEDNIYFNKENILFYKDDCFPHAWGPYETSLDVEFRHKEIAQYLSVFGKKLLFTK